MKKYFFSTFGLLVTTTLIVTTAGCSERRREADPIVKSSEVNPPPVAATAPARALPPATLETVPLATASAPGTTDLFSEISASINNAARDSASQLSALPDNLSRTIDAHIAAWKATGGTSTNMTDSKLALARTDFTQKVRTLILSGDDTWESAKTDALSSLENLRKAYSDLLAGKEKG